MELPVVYIFTHDSIGLGEDGPTHQPVEQLVALRSIPGLITLRPADANEVVEAWRVIIGLKHQPACLVLTRQPLPTFDRARYASAAGVARGAYVMADAERGKPEVILIGTGSEVALCVEAYEALKQEGVARARRQHAVVGIVRAAGPGVSRQRAARRASKPACRSRRARRIGWDRYVGLGGARIGMHTFGASAPDQGRDEEIRLYAERRCLAAAKRTARFGQGEERHEPAETA